MFIVDVLKYKAKRLKRRLKPQTPTPKSAVRRDVEFFPIDSLCKLEVYWKAFKFGVGPAIVFHALDNQVMRFDCFGGKFGHAHFYVIEPVKGCESRLLLPEKTIEAQIDRALFEISENLGYWMSRHKNPSVRQMHPDRAAVAAAVERARATMQDYRERAAAHAAARDAARDDATQTAESLA
ncbi:MAG: hypothetical protein ACFB9N_04135 [Geitlerinemataceae cyanobacterium]